MKRTWLVRAGVLGTASLLVCGIFMPHGVKETQASWNMTQTGSANLTSATIARVLDATCKSSDSLLGGPVATVTWADSPSTNGSSVSYKVVAKQLLSDPEWTVIFGPPPAKVAAVRPIEFGTGLLEGLLGGLLDLLFGNASEIFIGVVAVHSFGGTQWESPVTPIGKIAKANGGLLGAIAGYKCKP